MGQMMCDAFGARGSEDFPLEGGLAVAGSPDDSVAAAATGSIAVARLPAEQALEAPFVVRKKAV